MAAPIRRTLPTVCLVLLWQIFSIYSPQAAAADLHQGRIGLALSGGGARGAAHIGVLKVLEREGIHVDCVAGASFGAIVGGLYAAGYSAEEIETIVARCDWQQIFSNQAERAQAPLVQGGTLRQVTHLDLEGFMPRLPTGLLRGQKLIELVNRYTVKQMLAAEYDFDRLPVRFRAVSTDLLTGEPYIFRNGRMSEALRASTALPLIFAPWPKGGMLLVDGSMSNNLPADIVRDMGADVVIAVDATAPDLKYEEVRSAFKVYEQCLGMLMKQTVQSHYKYADIIIRPDLPGYSSSSYAHVQEIIRRGVDSAERRIPEILTHVGKYGPKPVAGNADEDAGSVVDSIAFETNGRSGLQDHTQAYLHKYTKIKPNETVRPERLEADTRRLYATGLFENVDYELQPLHANRYRLRYELVNSASNTLGVGIRYDTDYRLQGLTEFSSRDLFGTLSRATISTRFGSKSDYSATLRLIHPSVPYIFLEPQLQLLNWEHVQYNNHEDVATFVDRRRAAQVALGVALHGRFEATMGYRFESARLSPEGQPHPNMPAANLGGLRLRVRRDTLDAQEFPRTGMLLDLQADERLIHLGSDSNHTLWRGEVNRYFSASDKTTFILRLAGNTSYGTVPQCEKVYLGGYGNTELPSFRLAGLARDELRVRKFALVGASIRHQVLSQSMSFARRGFLTVEYNLARIGGQTLTGSNDTTEHGAAIGFSLDTLIGPVRFGTGMGEAGKLRIYFSIGSSF